MNNLSLITGASKGIGREIAFELAKTGSNLILVARSEDLLQEISKEIQEKYKVKVFVFACDLTKEKDLEDLFKFSEENSIKPNILVNNAGFGLKGSFESLSLEKQIGMIKLNIESMIFLTHKFLPILKSQKPSFVLNVASVAAFYPLPYFSIYAATKSFVKSFSESLSEELINSGIFVSALFPGPTESDFWKAAGSNIKFSSPKFARMTSKQVARIAVSEMLKRKRWIVPGFFNKIQTSVSGFIPKGLILKIVVKVWKK